MVLTPPPRPCNPNHPKICKNLQLFKMRRKVGKGFIPMLLMPLMGSEDLQNLLKFAYTMCSSALL